MSIRVTREQQKSVDNCKSIQGTYSLENLFAWRGSFQGWAKPMNDMTAEQISAAWLGVAGIEKEPFAIVVKDTLEGYETEYLERTVELHLANGGSIKFPINKRVDNLELGMKLKITIEGE